MKLMNSAVEHHVHNKLLRWHDLVITWGVNCNSYAFKLEDRINYVKLCTSISAEGLHIFISDCLYKVSFHTTP